MKERELPDTAIRDAFLLEEFQNSHGPAFITHRPSVRTGQLILKSPIYFQMQNKAAIILFKIEHVTVSYATGKRKC